MPRGESTSRSVRRYAVWGISVQRRASKAGACVGAALCEQRRSWRCYPQKVRETRQARPREEDGVAVVLGSASRGMKLGLGLSGLGCGEKLWPVEEGRERGRLGRIGKGLRPGGSGEKFWD